jgi:hypothetical protein
MSPGGSRGRRVATQDPVARSGPRRHHRGRRAAEAHPLAFPAMELLALPSRAHQCLADLAASISLPHLKNSHAPFFQCSDNSSSPRSNPNLLNSNPYNKPPTEHATIISVERVAAASELIRPSQWGRFL